MKFFSCVFTFSLLVSFDLKWVSYRRHMEGSCFLIHSATLCLSTEASNQFAFEVIGDKYVVIVILFIFFIIFREVPLTFVIILVWYNNFL